MSAPTKVEESRGSKNGGTRNVPEASLRAPKWYPADDIKQPKKVRKTQRPTKLRESVCLFALFLLSFNYLFEDYADILS